MKFIFYFVGDPRGYIVDDLFDFELIKGEPIWVVANVGLTEEKVLIDAQKSYLREVVK